MSIVIENDPNIVGSVAAWQNILNGCGYNPVLFITGQMDTETVTTTKNFQEDMALLKTGEVNLDTWRAGLNHTKLPGWSNITPPIQPKPSVVLSDTGKAMQWFKNKFKTELQRSIRGTPFTIDLLAAISMQETGYIWRRLYTKMSVEEVLKLCVGDTIDSPDRGAFPKNKAELLAAPNGDVMFSIAREALELMASHISDCKGAVKKLDKFCHGFGIFQYDLQFFLENPDYFLEKRWYDLNNCLEQCVQELESALRKTYGASKSTLSDEEMVYVAIAYNRGSVNFSRKFKQGYKDDSGKYYGEYIWEYLQLAKSVP
jgi:hypothetical protein